MVFASRFVLILDLLARIIFLIALSLGVGCQSLFLEPASDVFDGTIHWEQSVEQIQMRILSLRIVDSISPFECRLI